jgi:hypothetical protein
MFDDLRESVLASLEKLLSEADHNRAEWDAAARQAGCTRHHLVALQVFELFTRDLVAPKRPPVA